MVRIRIVVFGVTAPCSLVGRYKNFGQTYYLYLQSGKWRQYITLNMFTSVPDCMVPLSSSEVSNL